MRTALINELKVFGFWGAGVWRGGVMDGDLVVEDGQSGVGFHLGHHPGSDSVAASWEERGGVVEGLDGVIAAQ